jgi:hypothetical protein
MGLSPKLNNPVPSDSDQSLAFLYVIFVVCHLYEGFPKKSIEKCLSSVARHTASILSKARFDLWHPFSLLRVHRDTDGWKLDRCEILVGLDSGKE